MNPQAPEPKVEHNVSGKRFETSIEGKVAFLSYVATADGMVFEHTFVPEELRGKGLAGVLVRTALLEARKQHWRVIPQCPYVARFLERHAEFSDLIVRPG